MAQQLNIEAIDLHLSAVLEFLSQVDEEGKKWHFDINGDANHLCLAGNITQQKRVHYALSIMSLSSKSKVLLCYGIQDDGNTVIQSFCPPGYKESEAEILTQGVLEMQATHNKKYPVISAMDDCLSIFHMSDILPTCHQTLLMIGEEDSNVTIPNYQDDILVSLVGIICIHKMKLGLNYKHQWATLNSNMDWVPNSSFLTTLLGALSALSHGVHISGLNAHKETFSFTEYIIKQTAAW